MCARGLGTWVEVHLLVLGGLVGVDPMFKIKIVALPHSGVDTTLHRTTSKPSALRLDVDYWCCKESTSRLRSTSCFSLQPPSCPLSDPRLGSTSTSRRGKLELLVGWSYSPLTLTGICPRRGCSPWPSELIAGAVSDRRVQSRCRGRGGVVGSYILIYTNTHP